MGEVPHPVLIPEGQGLVGAGVRFEANFGLHELSLPMPQLPTYLLQDYMTPISALSDFFLELLPQEPTWAMSDTPFQEGCTRVATHYPPAVALMPPVSKQPGGHLHDQVWFPATHSATPYYLASLSLFFSRHPTRKQRSDTLAAIARLTRHLDAKAPPLLFALELPRSPTERWQVYYPMLLTNVRYHRLRHLLKSSRDLRSAMYANSTCVAAFGTTRFTVL